MKGDKLEVYLYRIVNVETMRALEKEADQNGLSYATMMQRAGEGMGRLIHQRFKQNNSRSLLGLVGSGNNGGDTLVAMAYLQERGWKTQAYLIKERNADDAVMKAYLVSGGQTVLFQEDENMVQLDTLLGECELVLDGILGTGFHPPAKGNVQKVMEHLKVREDIPYLIAVDCPSGVDCDSGEADAVALRADWTICMAAVKQGMLKFPAFELVGDLSLVDIGLSTTLQSWRNVHESCVEANAVAAVLPQRSAQAHKGTFGTALLFAGSRDYPGAAYLAGQAAYLVGTGLVQIASIPAVQQAIAGVLPEVIWTLMQPKENGFTWDHQRYFLSDSIQKASAVLVGPGWGHEKDMAEFFLELLDVIGAENEKAPHGMVMDADGLNLLSTYPDLLTHLSRNSVLTPHPGEMSRLTGLPTKVIQDDRASVVATYAKKWNTVVVLKGAMTVISEPSGQVVVVPIASPALARAGSGDVLAGMITGLMAQGVEPFKAAWAAAWIHGKAGIAAQEKKGSAACVLARDILEEIPSVFLKLK